MAETALIQSKHFPSADAPIHQLIQFAHTFDGYKRWGSFEKCAEIANARDHSTIDKLRTCLFFEARRWRHAGESPDAEALEYWRSLVADIRDRIQRLDGLSPEWLFHAIEQLPSDEPVAAKTQGYNHYRTQKDHWLGWLNPAAGTGSYPRRTGTNVTARTVYNRIGEPKMLLWLASAADLPSSLVDQARAEAAPLKALSSQCAVIRQHIPWRTLAEALESMIKPVEAQ
jgi:hypothetical protein